MQSICRGLCFVVPTGLLFAWLGACCVLAGPDTNDPIDAFAVRSEAPVDDWQTAAEADCREADAKLQAALEQVEAGDAESIRIRTIGEIHAALSRIERLGKRLQIFGETAGYDFERRSEFGRRDLNSVMSAIRRLPNADRRINSGYAVYTREAQAKRAGLKRLEALLKREAYAEALEKINEVIDELSMMGIWYPIDKQESVMKAFWNVRGVANKAMQEKWEQQAADQLAAAAAEREPDFATLIAALREASRTLATQAEVDFGGQPCSGPAVLRSAAERWEALHLSAVRYRALCWMDSRPEAEKALAQMRRAHREFHDNMVPQLIALIEADTKRAGADEAESLYRAYLDAVAPLVPRVVDDTFRVKLETALNALAAKSPELAAKVAAYRAATDDILAWRRRAAESAADARQRSSEPLTEVYLQGVLPGEESPGLVRQGSADTDAASLLGPAPRIMRAAAAKWTDKQVFWDRFIGLKPAVAMSVAEYRHRCYAQMRLPETIAGEVAALEQDLLVSQSGGPLTLDAAVALATARRGDLTSVGGKIGEAEMESVPTRFATMPEAGRSLIPLGPLPDETATRDMIREVLVRFVIEPEWLQGEHFFIELPATEQK